MLIVEFFPVFAMVAGLAAGVWLWFDARRDRRGRRQ
jgi:hypothetical protein